MGRRKRPNDGTVRPIVTEYLRRPPTAPDAGPLPDLQWIEISRLVVDETYQRPINGRGKNNILKIAAKFRWSCFAPVVVCSFDEGRYVIVDGQHRTTAAKLIGIDKVPCQIIEADTAGQALAFKEINGATTKMSSLTIHHAAVAAGDREALALEDVASRAGVTILAYPISADNQEVGGQTMSVATLERCLKRYGRDTLVTALQCVTQTENNNPGVLVSAVIVGLCVLLDKNKTWRDAGDRLLKAFDEIDIEGALEACRMQAKPKGYSIANAMTDRLAKQLAPLMAAPLQIVKGRAA